MFVDRSVPGGRLSLEYRARRDLPEAKSTKLGLLVDEFRGDLNPEYAGKMAGQATRIEPFTLDGEHAIWVAGAPHFFFYRAPEQRASRSGGCGSRRTCCCSSTGGCS